MDTNEARHSAAHYFLEGLNEIGIDYLFCNFGTDHAPLIEAMAGFKRDGRKMPGTILCPHEVTAVHMAAGYAMASFDCAATLPGPPAASASAFANSSGFETCGIYCSAKPCRQVWSSSFRWRRV